MSTATVAQSLPCPPNISEAGRRRRIAFGWRFLVVSAMALGVLIAMRAPWYWRVFLFLPAAVSAIGFLQARSMTCVARAAEGTFEHDDLSRTKALDEEVVASRRVSVGIWRNSIVVGLAAGALAAATAWVR